MFCFLLPLCLCAAAFATSAPVASTPYGSVRGFVANGTRAWRGIPYAASPLGDLRFRPPQPPHAWNETLETIDFGASCLQWGSVQPGVGWRSLNLTNSSEDCLFLNVYAPDTATTHLPVLVYLHAGEFRFGSSNDAENSWPYFADGSVILVTANVRIGFFGFAALEQLRSRDPSGSSGNYGMQDQRAVLKWVKKSIAAFGGDAEKVTVFGESSGGSSVAFHLASAASKGLFARAILESPGLTQSKSWSDSVENTQFALSVLTAAGSESCSWPSQVQWLNFPGVSARGETLAVVDKNEGLKECAKRSNCSAVSMQNSSGHAVLLGGGAPGKLFSMNTLRLFNATLYSGHNPGLNVFLKTTDPDTAVQCLVHADAYDLVALNRNPPHDDTFQTDSVAPTVDGVELLAPLDKASVSTIQSNVPLLAGSNLDEGTEFMYVVPGIACNASEDEFATWAVKMFGAELGAKVPEAYKTVEQPTPLCRDRYSQDGIQDTSAHWVAAMRSAGDGAILCRTRELLRAAHGQGNSVWWYYFTHTPIKSVNMGPMRFYGAFHGAEVPFVFGDGFELSSDAERKLSKAMGCYWINFAATGNPNEGPTDCAAKLTLPKWPVFNHGDAIEFSTGLLRNRTRLKEAQCDLFAKFQSPHDFMGRDSLII